MGKYVLAVNAGSSSVKVTFFTFENPPKAIADAQVSGITAPPPAFKYERGSFKRKEKLEEKLDTPQDAFKYILQRCFNDPELSEVASEADLAYICHRVVHGGDYNKSVEINDESLHHLEKLEDLAPLYVKNTDLYFLLTNTPLINTLGTTSQPWKSSAFARKSFQVLLASPILTLLFIIHCPSM